MQGSGAGIDSFCFPDRISSDSKSISARHDSLAGTPEPVAVAESLSTGTRLPDRVPDVLNCAENPSHQQKC